MKIIGLTGGIGSGKSTVAQMFSTLGIPIFISDNEGRRLLNTSKVVQRKVIHLLGDGAYIKETPNTKYIASRVFNDKELLLKLNAIIHPKVAKNFKRWVKKQDAPYCIKESAILFESGSYKNCDAVITVEVSLPIRIERVIKRDNITLKEVEARLKNQKNDNYRRERSDFVITNNEIGETKSQVDTIHATLLIRSRS